MSMSTGIAGIIPPDDEYHKMVRVYKACQEAGVEIPSEVKTFFNHSEPDPNGLIVELDQFAEEYYNNNRGGLAIDLDKIPSNVKTLWFYRW